MFGLNERRFPREEEGRSFHLHRHALVEYVCNNQFVIEVVE